MLNPHILLICDGWGHSNNLEGNAVSAAHTPYYDSLMRKSHSLLEASEEAVGLPKGQMGSSQVGHMTIGQGRIVLQDLENINHHLNETDYIKNMPQSKRLHMIILLSEGGIHSHLNHLKKLLLNTHPTQSVFIHAILDGRDTDVNDAHTTLPEFNLWLSKHSPNAVIADVIGRYYAMDRDNNIMRTQRASNLYRHALYSHKFDHLHDALPLIAQQSDEICPPILFNEQGSIKPSDGVFFLNFRTDRMVQLTNELAKTHPLGNMVSLIQYSSPKLNVPLSPLIKSTVHPPCLSEILAKKGFRQVKLSETEKFAHVTYFFNSGRSTPHDQEDWHETLSIRTSSFDQTPQMRTKELTDQLIAWMAVGRYDFYVVNFAAADMVGHTGNFKATVKALEIIDVQLGRVLKAIDSYNGQLYFTSDHGNAEVMMKKDKICTTHSLNPVPFCMYPLPPKGLVKFGGICQIAPTILSCMRIAPTDSMSPSLLLRDIQ